jgi:hypothetical protein
VTTTTSEGRRFCTRAPKAAEGWRQPSSISEGFCVSLFIEGAVWRSLWRWGAPGVAWARCKDPGVVKTIQYLHPILYQHPVSEIPPYFKIHFAKGIALEYKKEKGHVNWCSFGADTNKRQINCYERDVQKLRALRKTIQGEKPVEVRGREWRSIKVEPRV